MSYTESDGDSDSYRSASEEEYDGVLHGIIKTILCYQLPFSEENPGKANPKYYSKRIIKRMDKERRISPPPSFQTVTNSSEFAMSHGFIVMTPNRTSRIFRALAKTLFFTTDSLFSRHVKFLFMRQAYNDYEAAGEAQNHKDFDKFDKILAKVESEHDEAWKDEDWVMASKALFAPIYIRYQCARVPHIPHARRYAFSPVLDYEPPIKLILDDVEYDPEK